ncbi:DddA-like double-stranded DNA deaminase toxin [Streptomyces hilarionis]|uniref:DddA-like double-stranded DNA deaminase toxin n=1 Tax=Streptomyces hilarionis TaxID=2839954 RepID=UPI00211A10BA|nr:DddA-like double-stranded DNA deaminase toxin [Streptomyces hilarionis]
MAVEPAAVGSTDKRPDAARPWKAPKVTWPTAGTATVKLVPSETKAALRKAGSLPLALAAPPARRHASAKSPAKSATKATVELADRKTARRAGVEGLLFSIAEPTGGSSTSSASVQVDYRSFKGAYGGDWAARLRLVQLPACALTTPDKPACRLARPLPTTNNTKAGTLTATAPLSAASMTSARTSTSPTVLAATAAASGPTGDYKATSLQPSGSWTAGGATGGFSWSYPIDAPAVPGGLKPAVSLGYSSQAVDGRTSASNNQPSWIGDGWDWQPGYIERRYKSCEDDKDKAGATNTTKVGDQCWYNDNAVMSLGGKSVDLVFDKAEGWHPADDSAEKVEKLTGAVNGDDGTTGVDGKGEYWKVTSTDGTQYFFGRNRLPGWSDHGTAADDPVTNSTWTAPVFGNHSGEPCYNASFASAWCQQAWRWQLDYVVDPRGNAMAYYWSKESNNYGRNVSTTTGKATVTPYVRGGWLDHIDYGLRDDAVYAGKAMGQVQFGVSSRCLSGCTFDQTNASHWPDVPYDQYCKDGSTECKDQYSPTFWSQKRLSTITTKILTGGVYKDVDTWTLAQDFPPSGDGISTPMWLKSIQHTGKVGTAEVLPAVTFTGVQKPNRVDKLGDGLAPFVRLRMSQVKTETGGTIGVDYYDPDCTATTLPPADGTNSTRCYPVKWPFEGETAKQDWFVIYPVKRVVEGDNLVESPDVVTEYAYLGGAKWAKSTDEFAKTKDRTYSVSRGYERVQTRKGAGLDARTLTESRYFRGIDGADVKDSAGTAVTDREQFAGMVRENATYNGDGGALVSATSYTPWRSAATATRARTEADLPALTAYHTGVAAEETRSTVTGGIRTTKTTRAFDTYGMVTQVAEHGDIAKTTSDTVVGDEKCTTTTYARNTGAWILDAVSRTETVARLCSVTAERPADVIDDVRTYYDNAAFGVAPTKGLVTKTDRINGKGTGYDTSGSVPSVCGTAGNQLCYDQYGRAQAAADAYGEITRTLYSPATGENPTTTTVTNPLGHTATTKLDPLRGQPTEAKDANGKITTTAYDGLGRVSKVWLPTRSAVSLPNAPNYSYAYLVRADGPAVVTSKHLDHNSKYQTSYAFYDGLLRERQTQETSPDRAGRLVSESFYNTRGEAWRSSGAYFTTGAPEPVLVTGEETKYPSSTETVFDGAGRPTAVIAKKFGDETKRTTTSYTGDTTTVTPPKGGTATTTVVDALGRTVELKQYTDAARTSSQSVVYRYNSHGQLDRVTDASGAKWQYTYDVRGRKTDVVDPDTGASHTDYDKGDRVSDVTDARNVTLHTDYDVLGRKTAVKKGATTLSSWTYDEVAKGQPNKTTRYIGDKAYVSEITEYNAYYQPVGTKVTVPEGLGVPAASYEWFNFYDDNTGLLTLTEQPAVADIPDEDVTTNYDTAGLLSGFNAGSGPLISETVYDHYGRNTRLEYGAFGQHMATTSVYDDHTGALTDAYTDRDAAPQRIEDSHYTYDPSGNITQINTNYGQDAARTTDTQCFTLDALARITEAWTNTGSACAAAPSSDVVGGQDPYWTTYTYDALGNRKTETQHTTAAGPTADTVRTYAEPAVGTHNLPGVTQTGTDPHTETYTYTAGSTETRTFKQGSTTTVGQNLDWDDEGHLKSVTDGGKTTSYTYDADGQRLTRTDSTGTTLYLPGGNELTLDKSGKATGTRYYSTGAQTVAMRTGGKLTFLLADHHGTTTTQVTADAAQAITRRKTGIFGNARGPQLGPWSGDKGFVGGTKDTDTGLTHLGAREYDPSIGRFLSVDPIMDLTDPQQLHGYTYANNNPITITDPSGLKLDNCAYYLNCTANGGTIDETVKAEKKKSSDGGGSSGSSSGGGGGSSGGGGGGCSWYTGCGLSKAWDDTKDWVSEHKVVIAQVATEVVVGGLCLGTATGAGFATGGAGFAAAAGCGAVAGAASSAVGNVLSDDADHSTSGQLSDMGEGAIWGAASGALGYGLGKVAGKILGKCHSFLPGTGVLLADGTKKAIEDVEVGDVVVTTNPETGETTEKPVVETITTEDDKDFTEISIAVDGEYSSIVATDTHPFWVPELKKWVQAGDLQLGQTLRTSAGTRVQISALSHYTKRQRTHDLTIEDIHAYYVLAGATPVLVHNCNPLDGIADELAGSKITTGQVVDDAGNRVGAPVSSGENGSFVQVRNALRNSGVPHDAAGGFAAASHVETKIALAMRSNGVQRATVVINNSDGVCSGPYSCATGVSAILPRGSSLTSVWRTEEGWHGVTMLGGG